MMGNQAAGVENYRSANGRLVASATKLWRSKHNSLRMGVYVHPLVAQEPEQGLAAVLGKLHGEARGGGHGGDYRDARRQGFLENFERGTTAYE